MSTKERSKINEILSVLPPNKRLFRINSGTGWAGNFIWRDKRTGVIENPRPLKAAPKGWPDLCGWEEIEITPDMIGQKIAVFVGEEVKVTGRLTREQKLFGELLERMGGIFRVHRS
jgi:hypothetical protein